MSWIKYRVEPQGNNYIVVRDDGRNRRILQTFDTKELAVEYKKLCEKGRIKNLPR